MKKTRERLDAVLRSRGLVTSRQRGRGLILAGRVLVNTVLVDKPGVLVSPDDQVTLKGEDIPYVSRGGLKLAGALERFRLDVRDCECLDVGASTGGFTDCLLQNGASHVTAVDVGYGQLAWKLRQDPRVTVMERTNFRYMPPDALPHPVDLITIDVSFISLRIVLPVAIRFMKSTGQILALIKPQFEAGRQHVGKKGVVRDPEIHRSAVSDIETFAVSLDLNVRGVEPSPILGPKGNREFFIWLDRANLS